MQAKRTKNIPEVHILTQRADMKFIPEIYDAPNESSNLQNRSSFSTRLRSFLGFSKSSLNSSVQNQSQSSFDQSQSSLFKPTTSELKGENKSSISVPQSAKGSQYKIDCKECHLCEKCQGKRQKEASGQQAGLQKEQQPIESNKQESKIQNETGQPQKKELAECSECKICESCKNQKLNKQKQQVPAKPKYHSPKLQFVVRIAPEFILIGNQHQLDLINIGNVSGSKFIDTEYYWSFKFQGSIRSVAVDSKKMNVLAIIVDNTLKIYKYDYKKIPREPFPIFKSLILENPPFCMTMAKDGNICVFYRQKYEIYSVSEQIKKRRDKRYEVFDVVEENPKIQGEDTNKNVNRFEIFTVPEPFENILNIFFSQTLDNEKIFALWSVELEFQALQIKNSMPRKIYEIKNEYKETLTLSNYARDVFLMNLRNEINAVKPGYVLDSANIRMNKGQEFLNYMGNDTLLHTSKKMIEVYNFSLDTQVKPSRIKIQPKDSIKIESDLTDYEFFKILPVFNNENIIIFQIIPEKNRNKNGEVSYCMFLTKGISREEKINILFPRKDWKFKRDSQDLNERCDMARKMGLTVKEIFLELWNRTERCNKQDYEILISTNDYTTIKDQILRKLRKASMPFSQIWKIEQQCFLMLENRIFSSGCTEQAIMEYISCHFFIRKLEMFKDQEYMEKREREKMKKLTKSQDISPEKENQEAKEQNKKEEDENKDKEDKNEERKEETKENGKAEQSKDKADENKEKKDEKGKQKKEEKDVIKMTIRQYQNLRAMEIKTQLINEVGLYCDEKKESAIKNIRFLLKSFKFVFRTIYYDILEQIIIKAQDKLYDLIVAVPELLPYEPALESIPDSAEYPTNFFEGVWPQINAREWKQSLYVDAITTIDNKEIMLDKVLKGLSFRRNYLSQHDMVAISKKDIELNAKKIKSEQTFFYFISKMFSCLKNEKLNRQNPARQGIIKEVQKQVIKFLENYQMMPELIKGKVFLIQKLYSFLEKKNLLPQIDGKPCALSQFLKFKDEQFIRHCFIEERSIKGLILKHLKPLYEQVCGPEQGKKLFNTALLNYFISDLSEVSDLKYILNRINNEKKQFHFENQKLYEILVEALERKLKIGTDNDIPIQEVLIYIENIPFKDDEEALGEISGALRELELVNSVNEEIELLQKAKVNMTVYDILHKQDEVITKLVVYMIKEKNLICRQNFEITRESIEKVTKSTIYIVGSLSSLSEEIYGETNSKRIFFIYLTKLCVRAEMIKHACHLLQNPHIKECYDPSMADHIVQFLYKFKMSEEKIMVSNQFYVNELLKLLPPDFVTRVYIESQMKYAEILSRPDQPYEYPINESAYTISDLRNQLLGLPIEFLLKINFEELHKVIFQFQKIYYETSLAEEPQNFQFSPANFISLHQIYEILIIELLHARKLKEVLPFIHKILEQDVQVSQMELGIKSVAPKTNYNIIYPILFIIELSSEINEENKNALITSISYYFYHPWDLLEILNSLMNVERTPRQIKSFLEEKLEKGKKLKVGRQNEGYNPYNQVFNPDYLENITNAHEREQFMNRLTQATKHMQESKQLFKDIKYAAIMAILCNSPYALAKLIVCSEKINVSAIRCFLSYAIREDVFNPLAILELGRRIFQFLLLSEQSLIPVELVVEEFADASLLDQCIEPDEKIKQAQLDNKRLKLWWKSAQAFKKKKDTVQKEQKNSRKADESQEKKSERIKKSLGEQSNVEKNEPNVYPFDKIDHDNEEEEIVDFRESQGLKKIGAGFQFNADAEINMALDTTKKKNLFSSSREEKYKSSGKLTMSIRGAKSSIDHHGAFFNSLGAAQLKKGYSYKDKKQNIDLAESLKLCDSVHGSPRPESNIDKSEKNSVLKSALSDDRVDMESEEIKSEKNQIEEELSSYVVKINEVNEEESEILDCKDEQKQIPEGIPRASISPQYIARLLIEKNLGVLENSDDKFDFTEINNNKKLQEIAVEIYKQKPPQIKSINILNMIKKMTITCPQTGISLHTLDYLIDIGHRWQKAVSDIPFTKLLPSHHILHEFSGKDQLFEVLAENICRYADPENIYKIGFFVKSGFRNQDYESRIYWNLLMNLCEALDSLEKQEVGNTLQKIEGILEKANIKIWNERFSEFTEKVLASSQKQSIIKIFCRHLKEKRNPKNEAKHFLQSLLALQPMELVEETFNKIMSD